MALAREQRAQLTDETVHILAIALLGVYCVRNLYVPLDLGDPVRIV